MAGRESRIKGATPVKPWVGLHSKGDTMRNSGGINTLFLDIGGVLLSNGWDRHMRRRAAEKFGIDYEEMDERHHLTFDTYEEGKLSLDEYLSRVVFFEKRSFSKEEFKEHMYDQSKPKREMIDYFRKLKQRANLQIAAISNEGRELTVHRIREFGLREIINIFISSCFVHYRKPDADIYRIALDISQAAPENVVYIDDRAMFIEVAGKLGIRGIHHKGYEETRERLAEMGLR
jgi:putative hydrolase of the HAD superfamily